MSEKISVVVTMYNVEEQIAECLESVSWADEILAVDSFSTDRTVEIAGKYAHRVLKHEYRSNAVQNNWALPQASHPWVLILDSDERVTPELRDEIRQILENGTDYSAFTIRRQNYFLGKRVRFSGWQHDTVTRLFRKECGRLSEKHVHAELLVEGRIGRLKGKLLHYPCRELKQFLEKTDRYSSWSAKDRARTTGKVRWYHLSLRPAFRFFKQYVLRLGILDGLTGLIICSLATYSVFLKYAKLWEMQKQSRKKT